MLPTYGQVKTVNPNRYLITATLDLKKGTHSQALDRLPGWVVPDAFFHADAETDRDGKVTKLHNLREATFTPKVKSTVNS